MEQRGYGNASALVRQALSNELGKHERDSADGEQRIAAALEGLHRDHAREIRSQQAVLAVLETLVKTFLTRVPEPPIATAQNSPSHGLAMQHRDRSRP